MSIFSSPDPPGPVVNPSVTDTTNSTIRLTWTAPTNDGGSPVIGYLVESKRTDTTDWIRCNVPRNLQDTSYTIQNLIHKAEYQCRITAVNKVGFGEPVEVPEKHVAKDIISKYDLDIVTCIHLEVEQLIIDVTIIHNCQKLSHTS